MSSPALSSSSTLHGRSALEIDVGGGGKGEGKEKRKETNAPSPFLFYDQSRPPRRGRDDENQNMEI